MAHTCALIYAKTDKRGSYCGHFHEISQTNKFDNKEFLAYHSLPGPNSKIHCILFEQGIDGPIEVCNYVKESNLSQIPGFKYTSDPPISLPCPKEWT